MACAKENSGLARRAVRSRPVASTGTTGGARQAYTLLEVLLSLMLASLVLLAVATAVDLQFRVVDRSRRNVEEAQLARVLLGRIANDLRCAVTKDSLGMAELVAEFESAAAQTAEGLVAGADQGGDAAESSEGGEQESDAGGSDRENAEQEDSPEEQSEAAEDSESEAAEGSADSSAPQSTPGLYGESDWLQVDVAILPRLDQFDSLSTSAEGSTAVDQLSDVKTVTYSVAESEDETGFAADGTPSGGLVRRQVDRAASLWTAQLGQTEDDSDATPLAPEVSAIAFRYWDGTDWVDSWDSGEAGALPKAVEVTLTIRPIRDPSKLTSTSTTQVADEEEEEALLTYSRTIHLLAADASSGDEADEQTYEETGETTETTESDSTETGAAGEESSR